MTLTRAAAPARKAGATARASAARRPVTLALTPRALGLQRCACGGGCPGCRAQAAGSALRVNAPGDAWEREAERMADAVLSGAPAAVGGTPAPPALRRCSCGGSCPSCRAKADEESETLHREDAGAGSAPAFAPPVVHDVLGSAGRPLEAGARGLMESRFGADFGGVRVHTDARAAESARAVDALAYTVGHDVVFGAGRFAPGTRDGDRLLAHELAHVLQQGGGSAAASPRTAVTRSGARVARQGAGQAAGGPASTVTPLRSPSFQQLWQGFYLDMFGPATPQVRDRARTVLDAMVASATRAEKQTFGLQLALWFHAQGMAAEAERTLRAVEGAWLVGAVLQQSDMPVLGLFASGPPESLILAAEEAARSDQHDTAFRFFGLAYLFLQMQLVQETERRAAALAGFSHPAVADATRSMFVYPPVRGVYGQLRRILGFYLRLEREADAAGQAQRAAQMRALSDRLHTHIREHAAWSGEAIIAEVSRTSTRAGPGLTLHGANVADVELTPFQGLPTPQEVGSRSYQWQSLEEIRDSLTGQVNLLAELQRHPEIVREFGATSIDMTDEAHRLRVWRTMLAVFQRQSPGAEALNQLMALIGRYLRAFTIHTQYNIRDWGENYLTSDLPTDLAGRAERDCGVYALTVSWEVFRTARTASPRLGLEFEITVVPGHVVLVIYDRASNSFYVVNNDQVSPRHDGGRPEAEAAVASGAGAVFGRHNFVAPGIRMELGSTALGVGAFRSQVWSRYREAAGWSMAPQAPTGPADTRTPAELTEAGHRRFYEQQEEFDTGTTRLGGAMNALTAEMAGLSVADQRARLEQRLPAISAAARRLGALFIILGPAAPIGVDPARPQLVRRLRPLKRFLYSWQPPGSAHPLARAATALLRLQHLGGTLSQDDQAFVTWCDTVAALHGDLDRYRQAGLPPAFQ